MILRPLEGVREIDDSLTRAGRFSYIFAYPTYNPDPVLRRITS